MALKKGDNAENGRRIADYNAPRIIGPRRAWESFARGGQEGKKGRRKKKDEGVCAHGHGPLRSS